MNITKEKFTRLAKEHLIALESYKIDKQGNKPIEIFGIDKLYATINYTHSSMELPTKEEMNLALNDKVKGLRSDLKNEFNGDMQVGYNCGWQDCYKEVTNKAIT